VDNDVALGKPLTTHIREADDDTERIFSTAPMTPTVTLSLLTLACKSTSISHSLLIFLQSKIPSFSQLSTHSLANSELPTQAWNLCGHLVCGMIASTRIHKRKTSSLLSLCTAIIIYVLCGEPPSSCRQHHCPRPAKRSPQN